MIRALRAGRSRTMGAFSLHRSHGSVRCPHPRNPQTLGANVWVSLPGSAKSTAGSCCHDCRQGDRSVLPGFDLSSPLPAVSSQRPRLGTPASAPAAQTSALRFDAPDAGPRTRHPHLFSFRGNPNRVTCRFIAFPVEPRPHRAKKTPGLEDRALNCMELGSTCSFGGRDRDGAGWGRNDKAKLFTNDSHCARPGQRPVQPGHCSAFAPIYCLPSVPLPDASSASLPGLTIVGRS